MRSFLLGFRASGLYRHFVRDFFFRCVHSNIVQARPDVPPERFVHDDVMLPGGIYGLYLPPIFEIGGRDADGQYYG